MPAPAPAARRQLPGRSRRLLAALLAAVAAVAAVAAGALPGGTPPARADSSATTVVAPFDPNASATVSQSQNLVDQTVHVTWSGFKPSGIPVLNDAGTAVTGVTPSPQLANDIYPVRVWECRGGDAATVTLSACYGSQYYRAADGSDPGLLPDGPVNYVDAVTDPNGNGGLDIETRTSLESSTLGCDATHACSVVVEPNYGSGGSLFDDYNGGLLDETHLDDLATGWRTHIVIPLHFAPGASACPFRNADLAAVGSPLAARAVNSWATASCLAASPLNIDYTSQNDGEARTHAGGQGTDVVLTTQPLDPAAPTTPHRPFAYAPVSVSAVAVAFRVDDPNTGDPISQMRLTPRLVAKLITESYSEQGYHFVGATAGQFDAATDGNPRSLFDDPEFLALNPLPAGTSWPNGVQAWPLVASGSLDLMTTLTRWIAADPDGRAFMAGQPDPWGMHVNTYYRGFVLPSDAVALLDPYPAIPWNYQPLLGLENVARKLVANDTNASVQQAQSDGTHPKQPPELPGARAIIAITDTPDAAAFAFPVASLRNGSGDFVGPDTRSMTAAEQSMLHGPGGTKAASPTAGGGAYPLTMVTYAAVATSGVAADKAAKISRFVDFAAGRGQLYGTRPGDLPEGYLSLPPDLAAQAAAASTAIRTQSGTAPVAGHPAPHSPPAPASPAASAGQTGAAGGGAATGGSGAGSGGTGGGGSGATGGGTGGGGTGGSGTGGSGTGGSGTGGSGTGAGVTATATPSPTAGVGATHASRTAATPTPTPSGGGSGGAALVARPVSAGSAGAGWVVWLLLLGGLAAAAGGPLVAVFARGGRPSWWRWPGRRS